VLSSSEESLPSSFEDEEMDASRIFVFLLFSFFLSLAILLKLECLQLGGERPFEPLGVEGFEVSPTRSEGDFLEPSPWVTGTTASTSSTLDILSLSS
jgi:hypothetical protein